MRPGILLPTSIDAAVILPSSGGSLGCVQSHAPQPANPITRIARSTERTMTSVLLP
ncbi:unknown [Sutterella sp. CAG:351]|nr:unknown [Sutterella sp. CAG:351]